MISCAVLVIFALGCASADIGGSELLVLSAPKSVKISDSKGTLKTSRFPDLIDGILGLSATNEDFITSDIWNRPEAVAVVEIVGSPSFQPKVTGKRFDLNYDSHLDIENTNNRLRSLFAGKDFAVMDVSTDITGYYPGVVNADGKTDAPILAQQMSNIKGSLKWLKTQANLKNGVPDLFLYHLDETEETPESLKLLESTVEQIEAALKQVYGDNFVLILVKANAEHHREVRAAKKKDSTMSPVQTEVNKRHANIAQFYHEDYPVMFNIILWFMIGFGITIAGIAVWIWFMDPGKDSIIYRMTMARAKKD